MAANCFEILQKDVKDLKPSEVDELLAEMKRRQRNLMLKGSPGPDAAHQASQSVMRALKLAALIERRNAAINAKVRQEGLDSVLRNFADKPDEGLTALLAGSNKVGVGVRQSVDAVQHALFGGYAGGLVADLKRAGLFEVFAAGSLDRDVANALWQLDTAGEASGVPRNAITIAAILRRWQEKARLDANRAGAWVGKIPGYIVRQSHDADKVLGAGFDGWRDAIRPRLDLARMFPDGVPEDLDRWLREAWSGITTGIHESLPLNAERMAAFTGPGNLAKKLSQERKLHFKSADDWYAYNLQFGRGNLREAAIDGLRRSADATGLMRVLGTNPEYNLQAIFDAVRQRLRKAGDHAKLKKLDTWGNPRQGWGRALYDEVTGRSSAAVNRGLAVAGSTIRGVNSMASLGGAMLSSFSDVAIIASELNYQGQGFLGSLARTAITPLERLLDGASKDERGALLAELGYLAEGVTGQLTDRFSAHDSVPGVMSRAQQLFFKLNLLTPWTDTFRGAAILSTSGHLAALAHLPYEGLPESTTRLLALYGISPKDWAPISAGLRELGDKRFLSPAAVREQDVRQFAHIAEDRLNEFKAGLAGRLRQRARQDARELDWVQGRADKYRAELAGAVVRINERLATAEGKAASRLKALGEKLGKIDERLEFAAGWWQERVNCGEKVGFYGKRPLRQAGMDEGRALEEAKGLKADVREARGDIQKLRKELGEQFVDRWQDRQDELTAFADEVAARVSARGEASAEDLSRLDPQITRILEDARETTALKLQTLLTDRMNYAVVRPDARTRAVLTWGGKQRGTAAGELARAVMQFKAFTLSYMQRAFGREVYGYGARRLRDIRGRELRGLAQLVIASTAFGYLSMSAKDLAKGKKPRPADNWKTWMAAAQQGGGAGIWGDFLFGQSNRFGKSPLATLSGPTVGKFEDLWTLVQAAKNGDDFAAQGFRFLTNSTPFINLFYTRAALDYLIFYEIQESLNPGYLRRLERRTRQDSGQEYWLPPTEAAR